MANAPQPAASPTAAATAAPRVVDVAPPTPVALNASGVSREQLQAAAVGVALSPGLNRQVSRATASNREAAQDNESARQAAGDIIAVVASDPGIPADIRDQADALAQRANASRVQSERRQQEVAQLVGRIKKTFFLIVGVAFFIAIIADLLSLADLGWLVSWLIPCFTFFIVRRTVRINKGAKQIQEAQQRADRELSLLQQRLRPSLVGSGRSDLMQRAVSVAVKLASSLYAQFFVETVGVQTLELIPGLDWLPMYFGDVLKVVVDQYLAYRKARQLIPALERTLATIERLEAFELSEMTAELTVLVLEYQDQAEEVYARFEEEESARLPEERTMRDVRPIFQPEYGFAT